jgi:signal peptidase II
MKKHKKIIYTILLILILVILDQITKIIIFNIGQDFVIIPNILEIERVKNTGGAFGIGQNNTTTFIITNIIVLGIIIRLIVFQKDKLDKKTLITLLVILSGGFGNLIDRIFRGYVIDFINLFPNIHFPKFNFADIYITIGWIFLALILAQYTYKEIKSKK